MRKRRRGEENAQELWRCGTDSMMSCAEVGVKPADAVHGRCQASVLCPCKCHAVLEGGARVARSPMSKSHDHNLESIIDNSILLYLTLIHMTAV